MTISGDNSFTGGDSISRHHIADFWICRLPTTEDEWRDIIRGAVNAMGVTLLDLKIHLFQPQGATAIALLAESHLSIHTWPEQNYIAIDVFTCGESVDPEAGFDYLRDVLLPEREAIRQITRGQFTDAAKSCNANTASMTSVQWHDAEPGECR